MTHVVTRHGGSERSAPRTVAAFAVAALTSLASLHAAPQYGAPAQQNPCVLPIDGRPHDPIKSQDTTWYGDAVGKWEGDTLVIDIVGFNDESWIGWPGWFHSNNMHVIEKYTRTGNTIRWEATVEDPDVLLEPFHVAPRTVRVNPNPKATLQEDLPCEERDSQHIVTHERG